jgi:hypothetical protein
VGGEEEAEEPEEVSFVTFIFRQTLLKKGEYPDTLLLELLCSVQHFQSRKLVVGRLL